MSCLQNASLGAVWFVYYDTDVFNEVWNSSPSRLRWIVAGEQRVVKSKDGLAEQPSLLPLNILEKTREIIGEENARLEKHARFIHIFTCIRVDGIWWGSCPGDKDIGLMSVTFLILLYYS